MKDTVYVFDLDGTLIDEHNTDKPLPFFSFFKELVDNKQPVFILTARDTGNENHIADIVHKLGANLDVSRIICVGHTQDPAPRKASVLQHFTTMYDHVEFWDNDANNRVAAKHVHNVTVHDVPEKV